MRPVIVRSAEMLAPHVRGLTLACDDGAPLTYVPGQWVNLEVDVRGGVDKRAYSIASAPNPAAPEQFQIAVTRVDEGLVSCALHEVAVGTRLRLDGPYGFFTREGRESSPAWFVGTGTGVCPLRAMLQAELAADSGPALGLLLGVRHREDILYRAEFEELARRRPRFNFNVTLSRPDSEWSGLRGYVQAQLGSLIGNGDPRDKPHVYVCGLSNMVSDVRRVLKDELGYDRRSIHSERYD